MAVSAAANGLLRDGLLRAEHGELEATLEQLDERLARRDARQVHREEQVPARAETAHLRTL